MSIKKIGQILILSPQKEVLISGEMPMPKENASYSDIMEQIQKAFWQQFEKLDDDDQYDFYGAVKNRLEKKGIDWRQTGSSLKTIDLIFKHPTNIIATMHDFYEYVPINFDMDSTLIIVEVKKIFD